MELWRHLQRDDIKTRDKSSNDHYNAFLSYCQQTQGHQNNSHIMVLIIVSSAVCVMCRAGWGEKVLNVSLIFIFDQLDLQDIVKIQPEAAVVVEVVVVDVVVDAAVDVVVVVVVVAAESLNKKN